MAAHKGQKRALVAVTHPILVSVYHKLKAKQPYRELGADYLDRIKTDQLKRDLLKRLEQLAVPVTVQNQANVSPLPM